MFSLDDKPPSRVNKRYRPTEINLRIVRTFDPDPEIVKKYTKKKKISKKSRQRPFYGSVPKAQVPARNAYLEEWYYRIQYND